MKNIFEINEGQIGSEKIMVELKLLGYSLSDRGVRRYLSYLGLKTNGRVRKGNKPRELKNTMDKTPDLNKHQYNHPDFKSTDVSYILTCGGWAYLSIIIDMYDKSIDSWSFSKSNDLALVMSHFKDEDLKDKIIHSDHGHQYTSGIFKQLLSSKGARQSMSKIGDVYGNRESEYFFACIKTEKLNTLKLYEMTFEQVKAEINKYINWYNTKRRQKNLKWKTPHEMRASRIC